MKIHNLRRAFQHIDLFSIVYRHFLPVIKDGFCNVVLLYPGPVSCVCRHSIYLAVLPACRLILSAVDDHRLDCGLTRIFQPAGHFRIEV